MSAVLDISCPKCGKKNRHRISSADTIQKCKWCGAKYSFANEPTPQKPRTPASRITFGGVVAVAAMGLACCTLPALLLGPTKKPENSRPTSENTTAPKIAALNLPKGGPASSEVEKKESVAESTTVAKSDSKAPVSPSSNEPKKPKGEAAPNPDDLNMLNYELAKAEYHGWLEVRLAKREIDSGKDAEFKGDPGKGYKFALMGRDWLRDISKRYPGTIAADEASILLAGKSIEDRECPPAPKLPIGVKAKEVNVLAKDFDRSRSENRPVTSPSDPGYSSGSPVSDPYVPSSNRGSSSSGSSGDVYVRGYTRKDGTYVAPHYRSRPSR
jgi:hypothetical protein